MLNRITDTLSSLPREARDTLFLLAVIAWVIAPQVNVLPVWASLLASGLLLYLALFPPLLPIGGETLVVERLIYGEGHPEAQARNLRGQLWQHFGPSGLDTNERFDFKASPDVSAGR